MWTVSSGPCFGHKLISTTKGSVPEWFGRDGRCEIRHARRWLIIDQDVDEDRRLLASCHLGIPCCRFRALAFGKMITDRTGRTDRNSLHSVKSITVQNFDLCS